MVAGASEVPHIQAGPRSLEVGPHIHLELHNLELPHGLDMLEHRVEHHSQVPEPHNQVLGLHNQVLALHNQVLGLHREEAVASQGPVHLLWKEYD